MAKLNLPPFKERPEFAAKPEEGMWTRADGTLKQLGRSLRMGSSRPFRDPEEPVRAIPDSWAQARAFGEALRDAKHSMHENALAQWRGLLALLALKGFYAGNYSLEPHQVDLSGTHIFDRVMSTLTPSVSIDGTPQNWTAPWVVLVTPLPHGSPQPVGMTNPICLVSPGRKSHRIVVPGVAWAQGALGDPLALTGDAGLPAPQLIALRTWLSALREDTSVFAGDVASDIRQRLDDYIEGCSKELGTGVRLVAKLGRPSHPEMVALFRPLFRSVEIETPADPAAGSRTRLRLQSGLTLGKLNGIILADPSLTALPGINPRTTIVWGTRTLSELLRSDEVFRETAEEAAKLGYWIVSASDLFTARAVRLGNEAWIAKHPVGLQGMLLPLRPLALMLAGKLNERVSGTGGAERMSVTLVVDIAREEGDAPIALTRHFTVAPEDGGALLVNDADWIVYNTTLWPDFRSDAWSVYILRLLYDEKRRGNMARPHYGFSAGLLAAVAADAPTAQLAVAALREVNDRAIPRSNHLRRDEKTRGQEYEDIQISDLPFEAIAYLEGKATRTEAAGGLVLLDLATLTPQARGTTVAVDFGTTNTVACIEGRDAPPVRFANRLYVPISYAKPDIVRAVWHSARYNATRFMPPVERATPTPTVALERRNYLDAPQDWAFKNYIYFHPTQQHAQNDETTELRVFGSIAGDARFNLKWSDDPAVIQAATDFLEQFLVMVSAEVLAGGHDPRLTEWRFSIPDSMSQDKRENFEAYLNGAVRGISTKLTGEGGRQPLSKLHSEGLSAARYMIAAAGFNSDALNIVMDIGGGTTDITIWERESIRWRGSFVIAGQSFFTRLICNNPEILSEIGLDAWANLFEASTNLPDGIRPGDVPYLAEMLFSGSPQGGSGLDLQAAIDTHWIKRLNMPGKGGELLRVTALVFVAGLAWYVGRVVAMLVAKGALRPAIAARPAFALCGRGAGLFKKMHGDLAADHQSILTRALQVYDMAAGISGSPMPEVRLTKLAKLEVARGMLADDSQIDATAGTGAADAETFMPLGLGVGYRDGTAAAESLLGSAMPQGDVTEIDFGEMELFLTELALRARVQVDLHAHRQGGGAAAFIRNEVRKQIDRDRRAVERAARTDLSLAERKAAVPTAPEPPFISALRALVGELAAPRRQREGRIEAGIVD